MQTIPVAERRQRLIELSLGICRDLIPGDRTRTRIVQARASNWLVALEYTESLAAEGGK